MSVDKYLASIDIENFKKLLTYNLNINDEQLLVVGDKGSDGSLLSPVLSNAFKKAADDLGIKNELVLQAPKIKGEHADKKIVDKITKLPDGSIIIVNTSKMIGKLGDIGLSFRKFCKEHNHRFISASNLGGISNNKLDNFLETYNVDYKELSKKANKIKKIFDNAKELHVTSPLGTNIKYNVKGIKAIVSDGIYRMPGSGGNLPGTEVYIAPLKDKVEGKIVIDASMRTRKGTSVVKNPFEIDIRKGTVMALSEGEESKLLEETLRWATQRAKHPWGIRRIGEFGLGLNPKAKIMGCTVVDEKVLGTGHFAIGSNYWFGGSIYAIIHLDQVFHKPTVHADGKLVKI